ncbi:MAG: LLM class flavin-dependent oxidoreductase [Acidimicrobiales bacterium]
MRFILWIGTEQSWPDVLETARLASATGWDGVYLADHFMPPGDPPGNEPRLEAWTALAALAATSTRGRLGVLVSGNTYRHPAIVAKMAATTDVISGGRLVLGLGAGWQLSEHVAYGIELPEVPERLARLEEACQVVRLLFDMPRADFDGRYYALSNAPLEPKPLQSHLPLLVGVSGEQIALGIAARRADVWNCWGTPEVIGHKVQILEEQAARAGRDPALIEHSAQILIFMSRHQEALAQWRFENDPKRSAAGTPDELVALLGDYTKIGLDELVVPDRTLGDTATERQETMQAFLEEVAAPFQNRP